jgi:hypothetical protein
MIVSLCADKASVAGPAGVSMLTLALAVVWPGERLVLEADSSGGDALFCLAHADGGLLHPEPTLLSLTADARTGLDPTALLAYAQPTSLGIPVVLAPPTPEAFTLTGPLWPRLGEAAARWDGTVLADLGRLHPRHPAAAALLPLSQAVVLVTRADVAGLYRLRERVAGLAAQLAAPPAEVPRLLVVVRAARAQRRIALAQVTALLDSVGSPALLVGAVFDDDRGAAAISSGQPLLARGGLVRSARQLTGALFATGLLPPQTAPAPPAWAATDPGSAGAEATDAPAAASRGWRR